MKQKSYCSRSHIVPGVKLWGTKFPGFKLPGVILSGVKKRESFCGSQMSGHRHILELNSKSQHSKEIEVCSWRAWHSLLNVACHVLICMFVTIGLCICAQNRTYAAYFLPADRCRHHGADGAVIFLRIIFLWWLRSRVDAILLSLVFPCVENIFMEGRNLIPACRYSRP